MYARARALQCLPFVLTLSRGLCQPSKSESVHGLENHIWAKGNELLNLIDYLREQFRLSVLLTMY